MFLKKSIHSPTLNLLENLFQTLITLNKFNHSFTEFSSIFFKIKVAIRCFVDYGKVYKSIVRLLWIRVWNHSLKDSVFRWFAFCTQCWNPYSSKICFRFKKGSKFNLVCWINIKEFIFFLRSRGCLKLLRQLSDGLLICIEAFFAYNFEPSIDRFFINYYMLQFGKYLVSVENPFISTLFSISIDVEFLILLRHIMYRYFLELSIDWSFYSLKV